MYEIYRMGKTRNAFRTLVRIVSHGNGPRGRRRLTYDNIKVAGSGICCMGC